MANARRELAFVERLQAAEQHWFFIQATQCLSNGLYLPALATLLNGIEATIRIYVHRHSTENGDWSQEPSPYRVLSNNLLRAGREIGLPVELLAFPEEQDFEANLVSEKPNRIDVQLVALRNNLCHGNLWPHIKMPPGQQQPIFVPELLRPLADTLLTMSETWVAALQKYRMEHA